MYTKEEQLKTNRMKPKKESKFGKKISLEQ